MIRYAVAGTGHCGTGWLARVFTLAGMRCGHEQVFNYDEEGTRHRIETTHLYGDASLATAAYLDTLNIRVIHLVRDPLATVASFVPAFRSMDTPYNAFIARHVPGLVDLTPLERAVVYVSRWTYRIIGGVRKQYRMEQVEELNDPIVMLDLMHWCGFEPIGGVVPEVPPVNRHRPRKAVTWAQVDALEQGRLLRDVAKITGYGG